jgi:cell wall-associated NlpC family hydrolase
MPIGAHGGDVVQRTGTLIRTAIITVTAALTVTLVPHAAEARPHDPGDAAITAAQQQRNKKAADVGRLTALVAQADGDARRAQDRAELAVERYNKAVVDLDTATTKAAAAKAQVAKSAKAVEAARTDFAKFARGSYMQGSTVGSSTAALLDANSPTDLLQRADLLGYAGKHKLDVMGQLERANVKRANAESTARQLLAAQKAATARAEQLKVAAAREVAAARAKLATLQTQKATLNKQLEAARIKLNGLFAERARYRAWKKAQEEAAAREAARQRALRAAAAAREAAAAAAAAASSGSSGPSGSFSSSGSSGSSARSSGGGGNRSVGVPRWTGGGGWSASKGQRVADLAMQWLGTPYSWGGGNSSGPTWGTGGPVGFDCSGLALWAWAQVGVSLPHYSGYQYRSGVHISRGNLMPGDLVFWAYNTADPGSIHHVAVYIGGGRIVQAPQTGDVVKISYMWSNGYIGASRPGT